MSQERFSSDEDDEKAELETPGIENAQETFQEEITAKIYCKNKYCEKKYSILDQKCPYCGTLNSLFAASMSNSPLVNTNKNEPLSLGKPKAGNDNAEDSDSIDVEELYKKPSSQDPEIIYNSDKSDEKTDKKSDKPNEDEDDSCCNIL